MTQYQTMTTAQFKKQSKKLPAKSGIYFFKNSKNKPLYIGKALNLKNRVGQYLKTNNPRLTKMVAEASKINFIETDSEIGALILESQYIKKYKPEFNIVLRDDKQYTYTVFTNDLFPKLFLTHQPIKDVSGIKYHVLNRKQELKNHNTKYIIHNTSSHIGPFTDAEALKTTLRLLRRIFPYCTCKQLHHNYCLNYHIGKCIGDCCLKIKNLNIKNQNDSVKLKIYLNNITAVKNILGGKKKPLIKKFEKEMKSLSKKQEYEKAIELKNKIEKIKKVFLNAQIIHKKPSVMMCHNNKALEQLQSFLNLSSVPRRIEAYDIANIQGQHAVGAMAVFIDGKPDKHEYRKFKIHNVSSCDVATLTNKSNTSDPGMLREVLTRRFNHPEWPYPGLIVVDGGMAQLNTAKKVTKNIPIIALTKNEKHIGHKIIMENKKEIQLSKLSLEIKNLLLHIDSEAHRFAIFYYRKLHAHSMK